MKPRACRAFLSRWRLRTAAAIALGAATLSTAHAQESPSLAKVVQAPRASTSPTVAIETVRGGGKYNEVTREHAVQVLAATAWQADAEIELALVFALRGDPSEKVRAQAAAAFALSRYLTPKAHDALQNCAVGSNRDGFPSERTRSVKSHAALALQRHPTSGNPGRIAALQRETAQNKNRPMGPSFDGAEESSPPDSPPSLGRPVPTDLPAIEPPKAIVESPGPVQGPSLAPLPTPAPVPMALPPAPKVVERSSPATLPSLPAAAPRPLPPAPTTTIAAPDKSSMLPPPPVVDRAAPPVAARPLAPLTPAEQSMSLRERRSELRDLGLKDSSMKLFAEQVGAPPPSKVAATAKTVSLPEQSGVVQASATTSPEPTLPAAKQPAPRGIFGRLFGGRQLTPSLPPEQTPRSIEQVGVPPIASTPPLRMP